MGRGWSPGFFAAGLMLLLAGLVVAGGLAPTGAPSPPLSKPRGGQFLCNQLDNEDTAGFTSQDFETELEQLTSELADDCSIPSPVTIGAIRVDGNRSQPF